MPHKAELINFLKEIFITIPFGILLVVVLLLADKIKFKKREVFLHFIGSVIFGWGFSSLTINSIQDNFNILISEQGQRGIVALVTILGFLTLVYIVKKDTVSKYINSKIENKTKDLEKDGK